MITTDRADTRSQTSTESFAAFFAELTSESIPEAAVQHAKLCLLDTLGCGLFGSTLPQSTIVRDALSAVSSAGDSVVWGTSTRFTAPDAALVNGTAVHAFELDDLHPGSIVHLGSVVTPAALAVAPLVQSLTGRQLLDATIVGYEAAARVGSTMGAAHLVAGWHPTGTHGTIGAAVAASRVLGLDARQMADAIGIAGTQSAGLMAAQYESMVKRFHAGRAAQSGVYAALLGQRGYTGIRDLFAAEYGGYLGTFSPRSDPSFLHSELGEKWELTAAGFKPYSTNGSCHPSIDCLRQLFHQKGVRRADVASVDIRVSTATFKHVGWPYRPDTVTTAQMNLPFITAVVLTDGEAFVDQFTAERISDPDLVAFARRVNVSADPAIDAEGDGARHKTRLRVTMADGTVHEAARDFAHGSARDPMPVDEVRAKFRRLASTATRPDLATELENLVDTIDQAESIKPLERLLSRPHS